MVIIITGASVGFGLACARKFAKMGDKIIAIARREDKLLALQDELGAESCAIIACDVTQSQMLETKIQEVLDSRGWGIDVLINNAGLALGLAPANECDIADWERLIEVNVLALVSLSHFVLPIMIAQNSGHIINIGSIAGSYPYPGSTVYGATKAFVKQFSLNLRADLYDKNIRVSNIEPGLSGGSEFSLVRFKGDCARADSVYEGTTPLLPEDIAEVVCFVAHLPAHININRIEMMPTTQAPATLNVAKR